MITLAPDNRGKNTLTLPFLLVLCGYFVLHIGLRVALSGYLDYDEAEQALFSQWLLAGYTEQPPLYTWIQHFLFILLGKNVFAVSLMKNGLLLLTYICVFFAAREILHDERRAILATVSLLLIPQIAWESQRDMTHTTLVVFASAATLWQVTRLINKDSLTNYCILGLLLGTGILAKANYYLFISVVFFALSSFSEGRRLLFSRKSLISLLIAAAMTGTYFLWMAGNQDIVFSATHKFKRESEFFWYKGPISLISTIFQFLTPWWLICLLIFPMGFRPKGQPEKDLHRQLISRYILFLFLTLVVVVLAGKVTYVKDRWLQPLLFIAPIFFFTRLSAGTITPSRFKLFLKIVALAALAVYIAFAVRVLGASYIGKFCRLNYPFSEVADDIRQLGFTRGLIISDDRFVAGNLQMQFPISTALVPDYHFEKLVPHNQYSQAAVVWQAAQSVTIPADLQTFLEDTYNIQTADYQIHFIEHPYLYARHETITLAVLFFPLSAPSQSATKTQ